MDRNQLPTIFLEKNQNNIGVSNKGGEGEIKKINK